MTGEGHLALVVEDDADVATVLSEFVQSRGDRVRIATTVAAGLASLEEETPCYAILDQQLPLDAHARAFVSGGERMMTAVRRANPRRVDDFHEMPIVVVTAYSTDPDFVSRMYDLGADAFVPKPLDDAAIEKLAGKVRVVLERAGRVDHGRCGMARATVPKIVDAAPVVFAPPSAAAVRIAVEGRTEGRLERVIVQGQLREMQEATFIVLLRLLAAHERAPGTWTTRTALGIVGHRSVTTRLRSVFAGLVPDGFQALETDRTGQFRLNPAIVVEHVGWKALCTHRDGRVQKLARERLGRRA